MSGRSVDVINSTVADRFKNMEISVERESTNLAKSWIQKHKFISGYADGKWVENDGAQSTVVYKIIDRHCGSHFCDVVDVSDTFIANLKELSESGFVEWSSMSASSRSECLYKVAKYIEECQELFAEVECISAKKRLSRVKSQDIPNLIKSFRYNAGCALYAEGSVVVCPVGPMCLMNDKYSVPLLSVSLRLSSILAAGNSVLLLADAENSLTGCLLAEICTKAGIPKNVFNVFCFRRSLDQIEKLFSDFEFDKFKKLLCSSSLCHPPVCRPFEDYLIPRRPTIIIYEKADLHAAAEGVLESFFHCNPESKAGGCKVMIQQSVFEIFLNILEDAFSKINISSTWSDSDLLFDEEKVAELSKCLEEAEKIGRVYKLPTYNKPSELHIQPAILSGIPSNFNLVHNELGGPIIVAVTFRTVKESISMFNCDNAGSPVSVWSETMSVALEVCDKLKTGTVWVNSQNVFDASVPFSGISSSGNFIVGGKEEFFSHLQLLGTSRTTYWYIPHQERIENDDCLVSEDKYNKEYKLFINGEMKKSGSSEIFPNHTLIWRASEADLNLAVSCALAAQPNWKNVTMSKKSDLLLSIAKHLEMKRNNFVSFFMSVGLPEVISVKEVTDSIKILSHWALQSDSCDGEIKDISNNMKVMQTRCPLGVIGLDCPSQNPLLAFLALVVPAIFFGNTTVCVLGHFLPEPVLMMCEIFKSCGVPKGVINVLYGQDLPKFMCSHKNFRAIWLTNEKSDLVPLVRHSSFYRVSNYLDNASCFKCVISATFTKCVFLPYGDIFSN